MEFTAGAKAHSQQNVFEHDSSFLKIKAIFQGHSLGNSVLDIGCGDARLSATLAAMGYQVTGLDSNPSAIKGARAKGLTVLQADLEQTWPVESGKYDIVLALDVLEHLVDLEGAISQVKRVLRPEGSLYIAFPNHFDLRNRLHIFFGGGVIHWSHIKYNTAAYRYGHVRFLKLEELRQLLHNSNMFIDREQYNFMGGGLIPRRLTPRWFRSCLCRRWPNLFSGKFIIRAKLRQSSLQILSLPSTAKGI